MPDDDDASMLPPAHPRFTAHFTDALYESESDEFAPFGSDEGWDMVVDWGNRRSELERSGSIRIVLGDGDANVGAAVVQALKDSAANEVDAAVLVVSAGFTLLRLTGSIEPEDRQLVFAALDHLEAVCGRQSEFTRMRTDLASFSVDSAGA